MQTNPFDLFETFFGASMGGFSGMDQSTFRTRRRSTAVQGEDIRFAFVATCKTCWSEMIFKNSCVSIWNIYNLIFNLLIVVVSANFKSSFICPNVIYVLVGTGVMPRSLVGFLINMWYDEIVIFRSILINKQDLRCLSVPCCFPNSNNLATTSLFIYTWNSTTLTSNNISHQTLLEHYKNNKFSTFKYWGQNW
jgi:hypothetical protein